MKAIVSIMTPELRAKLIGVLERASDDPRVTAQIRRRIDRQLGTIKAVIRSETATRPRGTETVS